MKQLELYTADYRVIDNVFLNKLHDALNQVISGSSIGVTLSGNGSASAKQFLNMIIIGFKSIPDTETITINTPEGFKLWKAEVISKVDCADGAVTIKNNTDLITKAIACEAINEVNTNGSLYVDNQEFDADDDDLVVEIATDGNDGASGTILLWIENTD